MKAKIKTALLINPPTGLYIREERCQGPVDDNVSAAIRPPIDLMYLASSLESAGCTCYIRDYPVEKKNWSCFESDIQQIKPDFLIVAITSNTLDEDIKACSILKNYNKNALTAIKGAHASVYDVDIMKRFPELDLILRGEAEPAAVAIAKGKDFNAIKGISFRNGNAIKRNPDAPFIKNLDEIPFPARHLIKNRYYIRPDTKEPQTTIITQRGCPMNCVYCLSHVVAGSVIRYRSPKNIVDELEECVKKFNIKNFFFKADTFTWREDWVVELCQEIINRNLKINWVTNSRVNTISAERLKWMKKAGCWLIAFGIESGNQDILNKSKKGITLEQARTAVKLCKQYEIKTLLFFLIGVPWDSEQTVKDTLNFAKELDGDFFEVRFCIPYPGTELERISKELKLIPENISEEDLSNFIPNTLYLTKERVIELRQKMLMSLLLRPKYIARTLWNAKSPSLMLNYINFGLTKFFLLLKQNKSNLLKDSK